MTTTAHPDFSDWLDNLADDNARLRIVAGIAKLPHGIGDVKRLSATVSELRIDYGPGYRVYYTRRGGQTIILLAGGDKRTQQKDIATASKREKEV
jgi:putative addiction module killer protein